MVRYGLRGECRGGSYHDLGIVHETPRYKWEICHRCNRKFKWNKTARGRVENVAYLKAHIRNFAQEGGPTKRPFMKIYRKGSCTIQI